MKLLLPLLALLAVATAKRADFLSDEFIAEINAKATTWKAHRNFPEDTPEESLRALLGFRQDPNRKLPPAIHHKVIDLPETFDARRTYSYCPVIAEIRDQGNCGSCYAVSSAEVMSDRTCIYSQGDKNHHYSEQDIIECCRTCGFVCDGGWPDKVFDYWVSTGVVSGGAYNSNDGCKPYEHPPSGYFRPRPKVGSDVCVRECRDGYRVPYSVDQQLGSESYSINGVRNAMTDVVSRGPFVAGMTVYKDLMNYESGVYQHTTGGSMGGHAVKIMGYGSENGVLYWLVANSWNTTWGDNGTFKILRGANECGIEDYMTAGEPLPV